MRRVVRLSVGVGVLLGGLVLVLPGRPAEAIPIFPGNQGTLRVTFDNTGLPGFNTGPAAVGVGAFRMDTGAGTGAGAGGKVFLHSSELDGHPVTDLTTFSYQYFIDSTSAASRPPYANLRVDGPLFDPPGGRTLVTGSTAGVVGEFATVTVPTGATSGWEVTGSPITCNGQAVPVVFSLQQLATVCPGTNIVPAAFGTLGGVSVVTGAGDGTDWVGWTGVIDDLRINASQYDLEPARITITPASPVTLASRDPQTVAFTLQASGWNSFPGVDTTGPLDLPIVGGYEMQVGFRATGATTVTGLAGTVPIASLAQLASPPPPVTFSFDVTAALIGSGTSITVDWIAPAATSPTPGVALNATTDPATTLLQLPPPIPGPGSQVHLRASASAGPPMSSFAYGIAAYQHLLCDFDGDGVDGIVAFDAGAWYIRSTATPGPPEIAFAYGAPGYIPVCGDWNGDGSDGIGVYDGGSWHLRQTPSAGPPEVSFAYGIAGYTPVVGDWDGAGADGIGVFVAGNWYLRQTPTPGSPEQSFAYGIAGYQPVVGDWNGDGVDGTGVYVGGSWYLRQVASAGPPELSYAYGIAGYRPLVGDADGDGLDGSGVVVP